MSNRQSTAASPLMMSGLIALILADTGIDKKRQDNVASSIRRFCAVLDFPPDEAPAAFWFFRERLERFHPIKAGIKERRWATIRSDVAFALKHIGLAPNQARPKTPVGPAWTEVRDRLIEAGIKWSLSRLARYCDGRGIQPGEVSDTVIGDYITFVREQSFKTKPERHHREICIVWNRLVEAAPDLALARVSVPNYRETYTMAWEALPASFQADADAWLISMSEAGDLLSLKGPVRPLRPASIKAYRFALRQIVASLHHSGRPLETITSLADLVEVEAATAALEFFLNRTGKKATKMTATIAHVLVLVAKHAVGVDAKTLDTLKFFRGRLTPRSAGLSARPTKALRQFVDRANIEKLLVLPLAMHERQRRKNGHTLADARLMQVALALELLLMRPIRRKNLIALRLGEHVMKIGGKTLIVIDQDDVKNRVGCEYTIPAESTRLLDYYVQHLLPLFGDNPDDFLFPGEVPGKAKSAEQFGRFFTKTIGEQTGLDVYPHLLRHFGATVHLTENPNGIEVVRRVLGHRSAETTARSYAGTQDAAAMHAFDNVVLRIRESILQEIGGA